MENGVDPDSFMDASGDIVLSYRDRDGLLALRIPQRKLRRILDLEELAMSAREDLIQELRAGFRAETGELAIDSAIIRAAGVTRRFVRPARARDGKSPRIFVLSSRERRLVHAWIRREHDDGNSAFLVVAKARKRAWVMVRRECQAMGTLRTWNSCEELIRREADYHWASLKLRVAALLSPLVDTRPWVASAFSRLLDFRRPR
jgi:hypothetical protein